jgi:hypothetical protein
MATATVVGVVLAESILFLGNNLLPLLVLAIGGAMFVGNVLAIVRPPAALKDGDLPRAPVRRSLFMAVIGLIASVWAIASLLN